MKAEGVLDFQEFIRKELKAGHDVAGLAEKLAEGNYRFSLSAETGPVGKTGRH